MRRRWLIRAVCTRRAGYPPAVVLDAEGRTGTGLQGIACACPLAETGGVLPLQARNEVAYLLAADNVSGPLPIRLREVKEPVIITRNRFSRPRPRLLTCI
jgi:hypothetical protein